MTVSIIIAVKTWQKNLESCVAACQDLDYPDFEIIILPDLLNKDCLRQNNGHLDAKQRIKIIPTGPISPPKKRDMGINYAIGEIFGFIDDDAYPKKDWLKNAIVNFQDERVAAVAGPAVVPPDDNLRQKASNTVYESILVSGPYTYRYLPQKRREVADYPSCNFFIRKAIMQELGGFNTNFWPGEDTKLCLDIVYKLGKKIIYDPKVLVYHHRRPLFLPHLKQIANYALHRGFFVKKYPQTSLKLSYFIPSLFLSAVIFASFLALIIPSFKLIYFLGVTSYFSLVLIFSISKELQLIPLVFFGIIFTHLCYGFYFLKGLFSGRLKEE
jgi:GT2 family glycosyltransferase